MIPQFYTNNSYSFTKNIFRPLNAIHLNKDKLSENIKCTEIENDAYILAWDLKEGKNYSFIKEPIATDASHQFTLVYFLQANVASISINGQPARGLPNIEDNVLFANHNTPTEITFTEGSPVQGVSIVFTADWLQKQFLNTGLSLDIASIINHSSNLFEKTSEENTLIKRLMSLIEDKKSVLTVKSHFYSLVYSIIKHLTAEEKINMGVIKDPVMQEVEKVIVKSVMGKMPTLKQLADRFFMSIASLKRHFKVTFGSSIYNYFLSKKMDCAKNMLLNAKSVKEVCYALSYESVSHFTSIFKKYHSCCPSEICHKRYYLSQQGQNKNYMSLGAM
ncbi:MAG: AraC family transcriptional regulator [Segetibacter sp.]